MEFRILKGSAAQVEKELNELNEKFDVNFLGISTSTTTMYTTVIVTITPKITAYHKRD